MVQPEQPIEVVQPMKFVIEFVVYEPAGQPEQPLEEPVTKLVLNVPPAHREQPVDADRNVMVLNQPAPQKEQPSEVVPPRVSQFVV